MSSDTRNVAENNLIFGELFKKHFGATDQGFGPEFANSLTSLQSWGGSGWAQGFNKPEGLIWASSAVYRKFKDDFESIGDVGAVGRMRADFRYGEYLADAIRGAADPSAYQGKTAESTQSAIASNVFATLDFIPNLIDAYTSYKVESAFRDIRAFHADGGQDGYTYQDAELEKLRTEPDFDKLVELHKTILQRKQDTISTELASLEATVADAQKVVADQIAAKELQKDASLVTYIALEAGHSLGIEGEIEVTELLISEDQTALSQKQSRITEIEAGAGENGALTRELADELTTLRTETADLEQTLVRRNSELDNYRETKVQVDSLLLQDSDAIQQQIDTHKSSYQNLGDEVYQLMKDKAALPYTDEYSTQRRQLEGNQLDIDVDLADANSSLATHKSQELLKSGLAIGSNLLTVASSAAGLAKTIQEDGSTVAVAQASTGLGGFVADTIASFIDLSSAKSAGKASAAFGAVGAAAGFSASVVGITEISKQLHDPNISDEQKEYLKAEIGLQGAVAGLSAVAGGLAVAQALVKAGSTAATTLGKAVPIIGAIASVASAINPAKWSEFNEKQDRIDNLRQSDDYSADLLSGLLDDTLVAQKGFYGATTALNAVTGVASAALAATGVGAGVAVLVGLIGGAISAIVGAFEQVALEDIADKYADKIRHRDDGSERTVEEFFKGSFDQQQEKSKQAYENVLQDIISDQGFDSAVTLGSQLLSASDLELAAKSKTRGELEKTARHYFEEYKDTGGWQDQTIRLEEKVGDDHINLPDAASTASPENVYVSFLTPLLASGDQSTSTTSTGKNSNHTSVTISDLAGWVVNDGAGKNTTFNMNRIINSAQDKANNDVSVDFTINAGDGDDTLFAYDSEITFNGQGGTDTVSYTSFGADNLAGGITVNKTATGISVDKSLAAGSKYYKESIGSYETSHGKRTETVEYRQVQVLERDNVSNVTDQFSGIEIIQGSAKDDTFNLLADTEIRQIFGFDGDDVIYAGENTEVISGGTGKDIIHISDNLLATKTGTAQLYVDGGKGHSDTLVISQNLLDTLAEQHSAEQTNISIANSVAASLVGASGNLQSTASSLATMLNKGNQNAAANVVLNDIERVQLELKDTPSVNPDNVDGVGIFKTAALNGAHAGSAKLDSIYYLSDYEAIVNSQLSKTSSQESFYGLENARVASYENASASDAAAMQTWVQNHTATSVADADKLSGEIAVNEIKHISGKMYVVEGRSYSFREVVDDYAYLTIDGQAVISDTVHDNAATGTYQATATGFVDLDFYVLNTGGPGHFDLRGRLENPLPETLGTLQNVQTQVYQNASVTDPADLPVFATANTGSSSASSDLAATNAAGTLTKITGQMSVTEGQVYSFQAQGEVVSYLRIDNTEIIGNSSAAYQQQGSFKATATGTVDVEYYVYSATAQEHNLVQLLQTGAASTSADLKILRTSEYTNLPTSQLLYNQGDIVADLAARQPADTSLSGDLTGTIATDSAKHIQAKLYVEAGHTYYFTEKTDDFIHLIVDQQVIIDDRQWDVTTEGAYLAQKSGYVNVDYYVFNGPGPGNYELTVTASVNQTHTPTNTSPTASDSDSNSYPRLFVTPEAEQLPDDKLAVDVTAAGINHGVQVIGTNQNNGITGSNHADILFGHGGNDMLEGGLGDDTLIGGAGKDSFIFKGDNFGHDVIVNLVQGDADRDEIIFEGTTMTSIWLYRMGDHLVVKPSDQGAVVITHVFGANAVGDFERIVFRDQNGNEPWVFTPDQFVAGGQYENIGTITAGHAVYDRIMASDAADELAKAELNVAKSTDELMAESEAANRQTLVEAELGRNGFELGAELLTNGGFETSGGWSHPNPLEYWNDGAYSVYTSADSQRYIELDYANGVDSVSQQFAGTVGEKYLLSFDVARRGNGNDDSNTVQVSFNGNLLGDFVAQGNNIFERYDLVVDAAAMNTLQFAETVSGNDTVGPLLDNVSVRKINQVQDTNLLNNGGFEFSGAVESEVHRASIDGWQSSNAFHLFATANNGVTPQGSSEVYLKLDRTDAADSITAQADLQTGKQYQIQFDIAADTAVSNESNAVQVLLNGVTLGTAYATGNGWQTVSFTVEGSAGADKLTIREFANGNDGAGVYLDNVRVFQDTASNRLSLATIGASLILDGNFQSDILPAGQTSQTATDWTLGNGALLTQNPADSTDQVINLDASADSQQAHVGQRFDAQTGSEYQLSFTLAGQGTEVSNTVEVWWNGSQLGTASVAANLTETFQFSVTGAAGHDLLQIVESSVGNDGAGLFLDDVSLTALDLPSVSEALLGENLLENGDFESNGFAGSGVIPVSAVSGWESGNSNLTVGQEDYAAHESTLRGRYLELDQTANSQDQVWQDVAAETGSYYRLSYDLWNDQSGTADGAPEIHWNNGLVTAYSNNQYGEARHFEYIIQGADGMDRLTVTEAGGNDDGQGLYLDNFSLQYIAPDKYSEFNFTFS